jgi:outer membrane protein TolC
MKTKKIVAFCSILILSASVAFAYTNAQLQDMMELNNVSLNKARNISDLARLDSKDARASFQPTVDFLATGTYMVNPPEGQIILDTLYNFNVKITQSIFTWGKLTDSVEIYDNVELVRNLQRQLLKKQLASELKARESGIYYIKKMMVNLGKQKIVTSRFVVISEDSFKNGILTKQQVLEAQVKAKGVVVGLKQLNMELNNQLTAIRTLVGNTALKVDDIEFIPDEVAMKAIVAGDWNDLLARAVSPTRETFGILSLLENVSTKTRHVAQNSLYWKPDVALQVELAYQGACKSLFQDDFYNNDNCLLNVTLVVTDTIWDGGKALNDVERKIIKEKDAYLDTKDTRNQIMQRLNEALVQMDYGTSNIEFKELSQSMLDEKIKQNQSMMDEGYGDESDVLLAKLEKYDLELEALQEKITRASNYYTVEYLIGE